MLFDEGKFDYSLLREEQEDESAADSDKAVVDEAGSIHEALKYCITQLACWQDADGACEWVASCLLFVTDSDVDSDEEDEEEEAEEAQVAGSSGAAEAAAAGVIGGSDSEGEPPALVAAEDLFHVPFLPLHNCSHTMDACAGGDLRLLKFVENAKEAAYEAAVEVAAQMAAAQEGGL